MKNVILFGSLISMIGNCISLGKVGYIVPDQDDNRKPSLIKKAETCDLLGSTAFIDGMNNEMKSQKISELKNVNLEYQTKGCITFRELMDK